MSPGNNEQIIPTVVAVIGCDGSGKSTVSRWLVEELGKRHTTRFIYFGTGDGPGSRLRRVLNWLKQKSRYGKPPAPADLSRAAGTGAGIQSGSDDTLSRSRTNKAPDVLRLVWAAAVLSERLGKMREMDRAVNSGMLVVTDRYPQAEFWGIHDGPRLGYLLETRTGGLLHRIARWEQASYLKLVQRKPDLVLLLDVSLDLALARRPEESADELKRRISVARALTFQGAHRLVLDPSEPLMVVQEKALKAVLGKGLDIPVQTIDVTPQERITKQKIDV